MLKILRLYGSMNGGIATIIHAKVQYDNHDPFCAKANGSGPLDAPHQPNDGECISPDQAPLMWIVDPPAPLTISIDLRIFRRKPEK